MATPAPPMPPDVAGQASPEGAKSVFMAQGVGEPQPEMALIQAALQDISAMEEKFDAVLLRVGKIQPAFRAFLEPVASGMMQLRNALKQLGQRSGAAMGSPVMPPTPAGNPASGPPMPGGGGVEQ